jgi:hypothetical protein
MPDAASDLRVCDASGQAVKDAVAVKRTAFIALPTYTGQVWIPTMMSLIGDVMDLQNHGIGMILQPVMGCTYVHHVRGQQVALFLKSEATHLIFIDYDVSWNPGALTKLINRDLDVVAADYPRKRDKIQYCANLLVQDGKFVKEIDKHGLLKVNAIPAGLMCIKRQVIEKMIAAFPYLEFHEEGISPTGWMLFGHLLHDKTLLGDDVAFCYRWKHLGGEIYIDTTIAVGHTGYKTFTGEYQPWLDQMDDVPETAKVIPWDDSRVAWDDSRVATSTEAA